MPEIASLPLFHQIAGQSVLVLGDGEAAEPKRRLVERAGGIIVDDQARAIDEGVRIAFVAYEDAKACEVAAINLRCAGMIVNVVDRPDLCDFTTPSILDRDPLLIAVGTGGASAGLAKHVRLRLERILPQSLGKLALGLKHVRGILRDRFPQGADRRRAIDAALREGGDLDPLIETSWEGVHDWAQNIRLDQATVGKTTTQNNPGDASHRFCQLMEVNLLSSDPEDLTIKQARHLGEADRVCMQGDIPASILARARADAVRIHCDLRHCPKAQSLRSSEDANRIQDADQNEGLPQCARAQNSEVPDATDERMLTVILRAPAA